MDIICLQCQKDDAIQKVSAVVSGGHASGSFSGVSGGTVKIDGKWSNTSSYTTLGGISATDLARTLAPPREPSKQGGLDLHSLLLVPISCTCSALVCAIPATFLMKFDSVFSAIGYVSSLIFGFLFLCFCSWLFWSLMKKYRKENESRYTTEKLLWDNAIVKWNRLYYCHRDGIVFDPESSKTCQPTQIREFIYE